MPIPNTRNEWQDFIHATTLPQVHAVDGAVAELRDGTAQLRAEHQDVAARVAELEAAHEQM